MAIMQTKVLLGLIPSVGSFNLPFYLYIVATYYVERSVGWAGLCLGALTVALWKGQRTFKVRGLCVLCSLATLPLPLRYYFPPFTSRRVEEVMNTNNVPYSSWATIFSNDLPMLACALSLLLCAIVARRRVSPLVHNQNY